MKGVGSEKGARNEYLLYTLRFPPVRSPAGKLIWTTWHYGWVWMTGSNGLRYGSMPIHWGRWADWHRFSPTSSSDEGDLDENILKNVIFLTKFHFFPETPWCICKGNRQFRTKRLLFVCPLFGSWTPKSHPCRKSQYKHHFPVPPTQTACRNVGMWLQIRRLLARTPVTSPSTPSGSPPPCTRTSSSTLAMPSRAGFNLFVQVDMHAMCLLLRVIVCLSVPFSFLMRFLSGKVSPLPRSAGFIMTPTLCSQFLFDPSWNYLLRKQFSWT